MPLGALPVNNTRRMWIKYNDSRNSHEVLMRFADFGTTGGAMSAWHDYFTALDTHAFLLTIEGVRWAERGSDISIPITWTGDATYGSGTMDLAFRPRQYCWLGRSTGGRRFRIFQFGVTGNVPDNYRLFSTSGNVADDVTLALISGYTSGFFLCIDGLAPELKNYADVNFNDYWERAVR